ncbi:MAG TPA: DUF115 domain-containing protein [Pyrodictium sp.]|nr:DUF115 domain-containing protein [Pyrodictium sp.]
MPRGVTMKDNGACRTASSSAYCCSGMKEMAVLLGELLDAIRGTMGYSLREDCRAARILDWLLYEAALEGRYRSIPSVCKTIESRHVCIAGGSESLEDNIDQLFGCEKIVAVDCATVLLMKHGLTPDIVVTDLDGSWYYIMEASRAGAIVVVHAHGDNIAALHGIVPRIENIAGTTQCMTTRFATMATGFTDGDRALGLAIACRASRVTLYGMNTRERVGWWSKPWLKKSKNSGFYNSRKWASTCKILAKRRRNKTNF